MNKTATALIIKFAMTFVFAAIAFMTLNNNAWTWVLLVALVGTAINYWVGDLMVLPKYGNIVASLGDGVMALVVAYIVDLLVVPFRTGLTSLVVFGVLIAIGEYFFHQYLRRPEKAES